MSRTRHAYMLLIHYGHPAYDALRLDLRSSRQLCDRVGVCDCKCLEALRFNTVTSFSETLRLLGRDMTAYLIYSSDSAHN
jgi:hypothetical protein